MSLSNFFCALQTVLTMGEDGLLRAKKTNAPAGPLKERHLMTRMHIARNEQDLM
jgi:hypothetical protein